MIFYLSKKVPLTKGEFGSVEWFFDIRGYAMAWGATMAMVA